MSCRRKTIFLILLFAFAISSCNLKLLSETPTGQNSFDSFTLTLTGATLSETKALNITISIDGKVTQIKPPITFSATGAALILSDVNSSTGVITLVWSGQITDGKVIISGKINSVNEVPKISVTKVEAAGGKDITGDLVSKVEVFGPPVDTPTPTPTPTAPEVTPTPNIKEEPEPSLTITGLDTLSLGFRRKRRTRLLVKAQDFKNIARCGASASDSSLLYVRPTRFFLSSIRTTRRIIAGVPFMQIRKVKTKTSVILTVSCNNGAEAEKELIIQPSGL